MSKKFLFLAIVAILTVMMIPAGTASAQSSGVGNMNNEELLNLLQSILNELEQEQLTEITAAPTETAVPEITDTPEPTEAAPEPTETPEPTEAVQEITPAPRVFEVYSNKKLVIGQMPSYYFINKPSEEETSESNPGKKPETTPDPHPCPPGQSWGCDIYGVCRCAYG